MLRRVAARASWFLLVPVIVSGCAFTSVAPSTHDASATASASGDASLPAPAASVAPSPSPSGSAASPTASWGPLAVVPPQQGSDTARTQGTLLITDACVYLVSGATKTFLFWPSDRTTWNGQSRAITFTNADGTSVTVSDREPVVLGGGGDSQAESGISGPEWVRRLTWVAAPDPSCSTDLRWGVGAVGR